MQRFDFVIIGAGPAGEAASHKARALGASVAIIDRRWFGGSCPHIGCVPSKSLLHAAEVHAHGGDYPWSRASARRDYMINRERIDAPDDSGHVKSLEGAGATVIRGSASLDGPGRVRVGDRVLEAGTVVLAVGSVSRVPRDLPGQGLQFRGVGEPRREVPSSTEAGRSAIERSAFPQKRMFRPWSNKLSSTVVDARRACRSATRSTVSAAALPIDGHTLELAV